MSAHQAAAEAAAEITARMAEAAFGAAAAVDGNPSSPKGDLNGAKAVERLEFFLFNNKNRLHHPPI
jgi:hypothetical protein